MMTDRELLDALARDVARLADNTSQWIIADDIRSRHAHPAAPETKPATADAYYAGLRLVEWLDEIGAPINADLARTVIRERDEARREAETAERFAMGQKSRAESAESAVRELRRLCGEAAGVVANASLPFMGEQARAAELWERLRAAASAADATTEGATDGR